MAALLDSIVPSRRRERRRLLALEERLNTRFGDPSITAPTDGGWNTFRPGREEYEDHAPGFAPLPPVEEVYHDAFEDTTQGSDTGKYHNPQNEQQKEREREQATLTVKIPLPWKKPAVRPVLNTQEPSQTKDSVTSPVSRSQATSSTMVVYKPASEDYRRELERSLGSQTSAPTGMYRPTSKDYKNGLDEFASHPTRPRTPIPPESVPHQDVQKRHFSTSTISSRPGSEGVISDIHDAASMNSSGQATAESTASTPPADGAIPDEVVKGMADLGLCPSPSFHQGPRDRRSTSLSGSRKANYRESVSSSSSGDSGSAGLNSPRGLHLATMNSSGGYYGNLAQEYKQIAKTVEDNIVAEYKKKVATRSGVGQNPPELATIPIISTNERSRGHSLERRKKQPDMIISADRTQYPAHEKGRAQSVDRYDRYSRHRPHTALKDMRRGVSVERSRAGPTPQERCGPQQLVPKAEELWG